MSIKLTINHKEVEVPAGTTVLRAAEMAGIEIPTLCDHPHLTPYGGCRLCVVEVEAPARFNPPVPCRSIMGWWSIRTRPK
jgi:NADH dehydrogenase/NADH:ubiquinone oxidoreductase subunit G